MIHFFIAFKSIEKGFELSFNQLNRKYINIGQILFASLFHVSPILLNYQLNYQ